MRIVVTGAAGFCGQPTCRRLESAGHHVTAIVRNAESGIGLAADRLVALGELTPETDWSDALSGADAIVHLAAHTSSPRRRRSGTELAFRRINVGVTRALAEAALRAGVRRFVFASSIKVNGEATEPGAPFTAQSPIAPADLYARTKAEAETQLLDLRARGLEPVLVRPPVMYGPGMKGSMALLLRLADGNVPLPIAHLRNARDLLAVETFADLVANVVRHPAAAGQVFVARDGKAISTPELYAAMARALGRRARMWPMPAASMRLLGRLAGISGGIVRLTGNLELNDSATRERLQWKPPIAMEEMLRATAQWWHHRRRH